MRWPALILLVLLLMLQYPLWFGRGGYLQVREAQAQLEAIRQDNQKLEQRNADMAAEVKDLKSGFDAIEERARFEIGLIKPGEKFMQLPALPNPSATDSASAPAAAPAR
ncbi:cell division protein FtsB [Uliginosibacterium sp. sgz301328]|uniref:cell division protein FtsB n=1 Tax=Uliginosibacterium sp. sgz301328 TaxID=3243764 RepID=UPI00359D68E7